MRLVLASASPRRRELLRAAGFSFDVIVPDVDERRLPGEPPARYVDRVARAKAEWGRTNVAGAVILAADTVVTIGAEVLGKPADEPDARRMLGCLSGKEHQVLTGVAVASRERVETAVVRTAVTFAELSPEDLNWYLASREPFDKAGAYAIQGLASRFVTRVAGSYSNVVGLPVAETAAILRRYGVF